MPSLKPAGRNRGGPAVVSAGAAAGAAWSGSGDVEPACGAEASRAPHGSAQFADGNELGILHPLNDHLGNSIAAAQLYRLGRISVQQGYRDLAPVARIYGAGSVDDGQ